MKRNWFQRVLLSYLPVFLIVVCLFVVIGIVQLNELSRKEALKSSRVYVENLMNSMDMSLESIEMMMIETITRNMKLTAFAGMQSDPVFIIELSQLLQSMTTTNPLIDSVYVYRVGDDVVLSNQTKLTLDQFADRPFIERSLTGEEGGRWSEPRRFRSLRVGNDEVNVISMVKGIPLNGKGIALLVVNVRTSDVRGFFENFAKSEVNSIAVLDRQGQHLFQSERQLEQRDSTTLTSAYTGWTYKSSLKTALLGNMYSYVTSIWFLIGLLGVLGGIVWIIYVTRQNYRPIETMMTRIQKYNQQHKEHPIPEPPVDELSYIDFTLNSIMEVTEDYHNRHLQNQTYRRLRLFQDLVEGSFTGKEEEWTAELRELGLDRFGGLSVSLIEIDKYMEFISLHSRQDQQLFKYILRKVVEETAEAAQIRIWQEWVTNHRLCVICYDEQEALIAEHRMLAVAEKVRLWLQDNLRLTVTFGLGSEVSNLPSVAQSYDSASRALDYKSALGSNRVIGHWEIELLSHDDLFVYLQYVRTIAQTFRVSNESWREQLKLLFDGLRTLLLPREEISGILTYMNYYFYREMMELPPEYQELWNRELRVPWDERMESLETLDELEAFYTDNLSACAQKMDKIRESKGNHGVVQKVRDYIGEHYSNPDLSLSLLSEQFHMNSSSLSTLFKEEFGEKFVVYLCQVRMEHAKELLRGTSLPLQSISEKVGYQHQMSFIRAFKKMVGTTPGDYRKVHQ